MGIPDMVSLATVRMREILDRKNVAIVTDYGCGRGCVRELGNSPWQQSRSVTQE